MELSHRHQQRAQTRACYFFLTSCAREREGETQHQAARGVDEKKSGAPRVPNVNAQDSVSDEELAAPGRGRVTKPAVGRPMVPSGSIPGHSHDVHTYLD